MIYFRVNGIALHGVKHLETYIVSFIYISSNDINRSIEHTPFIGLCQMSSMTGNGVRVQYQRKSNYPNRMEFNSSRSSVGTTPRKQRKKTVKGTGRWGELKWLNRKRKRHPSLWPLTRFPPSSLVSLFLSRFGGRFHVYFNTAREPSYFTPLQIEIVSGFLY